MFKISIQFAKLSSPEVERDNFPITTKVKLSRTKEELRTVNTTLIILQIFLF